MKTVCLITPGHIASNPRLVKEAMVLSQSGYKVHVVFTQYVSYLVNYDNQILSKNPTWTYDCIDWTGQTLPSKFNRLLNKLLHSFSNNINIKLNRNYLWQLRKAIACKTDIYIAHNLGTLPIAVTAAKKTNAKCCFDAEDFHRNEVSDDPESADVKLKTAIENLYIPQLDYMTASSPQITDRYSSIFKRKVITILNVFPKTDPYPIINNIAGRLQLFWFSQTIGPNRGLEAIIEAINRANLNADLHLLGMVTNEFKNHLIQIKSNNSNCIIHFHDPLYPDEIFNIAKQYDIGFASETGFCLNNKIALSNKLFTYLQSGLAIIASGTIAQKAFLKQNTQIGSLYNNVAELAETLLIYNNNRKLLYQTKKAAFELGQSQFYWEKESKNLPLLING